MNRSVRLVFILAGMAIAVAVSPGLTVKTPAPRIEPKAGGFEPILAGMRQAATAACRCEFSGQPSKKGECWKTYDQIMGAFEHVRSEVTSENISVQSDCLGLVRNREPCIALRYRVHGLPSGSAPFVCSMNQARALQTTSEGRSKGD